MRNTFHLINFLIHSNIYLALGSLCLSFLSMVLLNFQPKYEPLIIVFSTTLFLYNFNRKTDIKEDLINYPERVNFLKKYGTYIFYFSNLLYVFSLLLAAIHSIYTLIIALIPTIIMFAYAVLRLKKILFIKNVVASLGWATMMLLVGKYYDINLFNLSLLSLVLFIFLRLLLNTIIFDIRDIEGDKKVGTTTIPIKVGIKNTKKILSIVNIFSALFLCFSTSVLSLNSIGYLVSLIAFIYGQYCISSIGKLEIKKLCEIVDGEMLTLGVVGIIGFVLW